jgi:hypothetical protein
MYTELKRVLFYEMSADDLKGMIKTLPGKRKEIDLLGGFLLQLREEMSNDDRWESSVFKSTLEATDRWEEMKEKILFIANDYAKKHGANLGKF